MEEEINKEPQGITAVKRISIRYSLYILTFRQEILEKINIGYLKKETQPYIPNPQICFHCQKFGHIKNSCKGKAVCAGCCEEGHNLDDCQNAQIVKVTMLLYQEIAQNGNWKKNIVTLKYTEKISFADAHKRLQPTFDPFIWNTNPSSIFKTSSTLGQKKKRLPIDFKTEVQYLKYILNHCLTWLDTLNEITSENPVPWDAPSVDKTPPLPKLLQNKKLNHNPEYWVCSTICSFKWWRIGIDYS